MFAETFSGVFNISLSTPGDSMFAPFLFLSDFVGIRRFVFLRSADCDSLSEFVRRNAQTLRRVRISFTDNVNIYSLLYDNNNTPVEYPQLVKLAIDDNNSGFSRVQALLLEQAITPAGSATHFPRLERLYYWGIYNFTNDVLFRGTDQTLKLLDITISDQLMNVIMRYGLLFQKPFPHLRSLRFNKYGLGYYSPFSAVYSGFVSQVLSNVISSSPELQHIKMMCAFDRNILLSVCPLNKNFCTLQIRMEYIATARNNIKLVIALIAIAYMDNGNTQHVDNSVVSESDEVFEASKLGSKDHWDSVYVREIKNFNESGDIGEVWFGEDAAAKMVTWVCRNIEDPATRILDVGCGNGHLLLELAEEGYTNLVGTDYSGSAVQLAQQVAESREANVVFLEQDFLDPQDVARVAGESKFDVVLDKGTYDAICLKPQDGDSVAVDQSAIDMYPVSVVNSLTDSGVFLITSCNWTEDELIKRFESHLECVDRVKHKSFKFGGAVGQTVATVAFKKRFYA
ncbi:Protein-lysine N-methyltransferase efm4 [Coemansia sp. Benny D115]|nr:Protein-lysine N-methyltransferase efm4 [Coemansia sp. Benny D115]